MDEIIAGVDIGGTHITVSLVDICKGELMESTLVREHLDPSLDKDIIIQTWAAAIHEAFEKGGLEVGKIGIAMPGPFDYEKGISYIKGLHKYEQLYGFNVKELLAGELGIRPADIRMINDASAFLLGEYHCGAGKQADNLVGITLGTGLGSAAWYNYRIVEGDLYNMPYKDSRAEDHVCARWLINSFEKLTGEKVSGVKSIALRCPADRQARELFINFGRNLGEVIATRYTDQSPTLVVIGGNISRAWTCFIPAAQEVLTAKGFPGTLKRAELGEEAALIGASYLWKEKKDIPA